MKIKKYVGFLAAIGVGAVGLANLEGVGFFAPSIDGKENVYAPEVGAIIYDKSDGRFYGRSHAGAWETMGTPASFHIRGKITGDDNQLTNVTSGGFVGIENSNYTLTMDKGTGTIPCSGTNASTGTTCASGDESVGVQFTIDSIGHYRVCFDISHYSSSVNSAASSTIKASFKVVETGNLDQVVLAEGGPEISVNPDRSSNNTVETGGSSRVCGDFDFTTTGLKTIRLFWDYIVNGTGASFKIINTQSGSQNIYFTVDRMGD